MEVRNKEFMIEEIVFRTFLKHIKLNNLYIPFRWSVNLGGGYNKDIIHILSYRLCDANHQASMERASNYGSYFLKARSVNDILKIMRGMNGGELTIKDDGKFQMAIMQMTNHLIHCCIEYKLSSEMNMIEKIGASVFEDACKELLGKDFVDKTEEMIDPKHRSMLEAIARSGGIPKHGSDAERYFKKMFERKREEIMDSSYLKSYAPFIPPTITYSSTDDFYEVDLDDIL